MTKEDWLRRYGWCEILENTPVTRAFLASSGLADRLDQTYIWSEFERACEDPEEYFTGTRWREIIRGVYPDAARFYWRERISDGYWTVISGDLSGARARNFYLCEACGHEWTDEHPGSPADDCERCGERHLEPWRTEVLDAQGNVVSGQCGEQ
jgi:hypothetical protein